MWKEKLLSHPSQETLDNLDKEIETIENAIEELNTTLYNVSLQISSQEGYEVSNV